MPIASWIIISSAKPKLINVPIKTGTIIKPPPIPNIPAKRPASIPSAPKINISSNIIKLSAERIF